ncbi:MAG: protein kinase [Lentisphaerales bacterium]|nr:protein kinase [Lentisphaerales bacterium]
MFKLYGMNDDEYSLNRQVSDFFDEALGLGLADDLKKIDNDRYLPGKKIAQGGMKSIEIAVDTVTGREVAKALLIGTDDPEKVERFFHEARICASLEHPNIVPVYDAGYDNEGQPFFTMRLLGGQTLQKRVTKSDTSTATLLDIFVKICDAVSYAHSQGIIHRDLKPDNIQIGDFGEVQVCDWGLACSNEYKNNTQTIDQSTKEYVIPVTLDGMIKGTPGYLSPEQASSERQELTSSSDIYSLGAILFFILTSRNPLEGFDTITSIKKTLTGEIKPIKDICPETPKSLIAICKKAMEVKRENRYENVEALKADLVKYQHGFPTAAEEAGTWDSLKLFVKRNQRTTVLVATFLFIFNTTLIWFLVNLSTKEKQAREAKVEAIQSEQQAKKAEKQAREAEEDAYEAATLARQSELATLEAMRQVKKAHDDLKEMTAQKDNVSKKAAPRFIRLGKMDRSAFQFNKALKLLDQALLLSPGNLEALDSKAKILMALMRFDEALGLFKKLKGGNKSLITVCEIITGKRSDKDNINLTDIYEVFTLYKKYHLGQQFQRELIYSPVLDFLNEEQRREFAVNIFCLYTGTNPKKFSVIKATLERKMPSLLYRTGIHTFDLRKITKMRTFMIRGDKTERVILPEGFNINIVYNDLKACPNLKEIYVPKSFEAYDYFSKLNVKILNHKEYR